MYLSHPNKEGNLILFRAVIQWWSCCTLNVIPCWASLVPTSGSPQYTTSPRAAWKSGQKAREVAKTCSLRQMWQYNLYNIFNIHNERTYLGEVADADSSNPAFFYSNPFMLVCEFKCYKTTHETKNPSKKKPFKIAEVFYNHRLVGHKRKTTTA